MSKIQVDMFEVQLGAALLLQFKDNKNRNVRILADAGIHASNYKKNHVHNKLPKAFKDFGGKDNDRRLDLIIGTHYDKDHLNGLIPIIKDKSIEIGAAWMPPVANDTEYHFADAHIEDENFLIHQFTSDDGDDRLRKYLSNKLDECNQLYQQEYSIFNGPHDFSMRTRLADIHTYYANGDFVLQHTEETEIDSLKVLLGEHLENASKILQDGESSHADRDIGIPMDADGLAALPWKRNRQSIASFPQQFGSFEKFLPPESRFPMRDLDRQRLAGIRESIASDAINAGYLHQVATALRARKIPTFSRRIDDGQPQRFIWKSDSRQFVPRKKASSDGPTLTLLGPSEHLIRKHWNQLPIGEYMMLAVGKEFPLGGGITASNQLSYVVRIEDNEQGILVSGDAGFVDFKPQGKRTYFKKLLNALLPLHIIQVAHHGGRNAHFYRGMLKAKYAEQKDKSFLLLSHKTHDKYRPSDVFGKFIEEVVDDGDAVRLLFTSEPKLDRVRDYIDLIHPTIGRQADRGDVRISFDGKKWSVKKHAIKVS